MDEKGFIIRFEPAKEERLPEAIAYLIRLVDGIVLATPKKEEGKV